MTTIDRQQNAGLTRLRQPCSRNARANALWIRRGQQSPYKLLISYVEGLGLRVLSGALVHTGWYRTKCFMLNRF